VTQLLCQQSNEVKVLKMTKNFTSLQVKVLELFFTFVEIEPKNMPLGAN